MPGWNRIKRTGICKAICLWKDLKSLTMPCIINPSYLMNEIAMNCKKFAELKIMNHCDPAMATTLVAYLPNLKVLSLRCTTIWRDALTNILDGLQTLEVLNISHCLLIDVPPPPAPTEVFYKLDQSILKKALRLKKFIMCMSESCIMCQRMRNDEGRIRWYKYEEELWKEDEITSLAVP